MASPSQSSGTRSAPMGTNNHSNSASHPHHHLSYRTTDRPNADPKEHMLCLMRPLTYTTQKTSHIYTHFRNQKPSFPLLCNEGILINSSLVTCIYLWFPLLCNKDTLLLSDQLTFSVGCLTRLPSTSKTSDFWIYIWIIFDYIPGTATKKENHSIIQLYRNQIIIQFQAVVILILTSTIFPLCQAKFMRRN